MKKTLITRLRSVGTIEAFSYLLLVFVAMPLKYLADMPVGVKVVGMAHGLLFIAYVALGLKAARDFKWPLSRVVQLFVASVLPFGPFVFDGWLKREEARGCNENCV